MPQWSSRRVPGAPTQHGRKCLREMKDDAESDCCWSIVVFQSAPWKVVGAVLAMFSLGVTLLCTRLLLVHFLVNLPRAGVTGGKRLSRCHSFALLYLLWLLFIIYQCLSLNSESYFKLYAFILLTLKKVLECAGNRFFHSDWSWYLTTVSKIRLTRDMGTSLKKMNPLNIHTFFSLSSCLF